MSLSSERFTFEKFNGQNFHTWQIKVKMALIERDLWKVVNGSEPKPLENDDLQSKWEQKDAKAFSIIVLSIADSQISHVSSAGSSTDAWERLTTTFGQRNAVSRMFLKKSFYKIQMTGDGSVAAHVNNVRAMMDQLAGAGAAVSEEEAVFVLLSSMPESYDHIVATIVGQSNVTLADATVGLIQEETRRKASGISDHNGNEVAFLTTSQQKKWSKGKQPERVCFYCKKPGHYIRDCKKLVDDVIEKKTKEHTTLFASEETNEQNDEQEYGEKLF